MSAAILPINTTTDWIFNGVTYRYDDTEDRWYVVSTQATDQVVQDLDTLNKGLESTNDIINQEIENRGNLLNAAADRNNNQDSAIDELSARVDALGAAVGSLTFTGVYTYVLEKSADACNAAYVECLLQAGSEAADQSTCASLNGV